MTITLTPRLIVTDDDVASDEETQDSSTFRLFYSCAEVIASTIQADVIGIKTLGYALPGDGGGGVYKRVSAVPPHSGYFQSLDGAYWEYTPDERGFNVLAFGADTSGNTAGARTANNAAMLGAYNCAFNNGGGVIYFPPGVYNYDSPWIIDTSTLTPGLQGVGLISVEGDGVGRTTLFFRSTTAGHVALKFLANFITGGQAGRGIIAKGFTLAGSGLALTNQTGLWIEFCQVKAVVEDLNILSFYLGVWVKDTVGLDFYKSTISFCSYGLDTSSSFTNSPVNESTFFGCHIVNNRQFGARFNLSAPIAFVGGSFEGNGLTGAYTSDAERWDVRINNGGYNGTMSLALYGVHFESSGGQACIWIDHDAYPSAYNISGCSFFRNGAFSPQSTNCIRLDTTGTSRCVVNVTGCGFGSVNGYTPSTSERCIAEGTVSGSLHTWNLRGNMYENTDEIPLIPSTTDHAATDQIINSVDSASVEVLRLAGKRPTAAAFDTIYQSMFVQDAAGSSIEVARVGVQATAVTAGAVSSRMIFGARTSGSFAYLLFLNSTALTPAASDQIALGSSALPFSDLFLASGGRIYHNNSAFDTWGTGTPEGVVTAPVGSTFRRTDGGAGTTFYVKESGAGNTGWVGK